jgi:prolipoprotein diacylglyceryl transferase
MNAALIASIPSPGSKGFSIAGLELRAYGLMIALGVIAGVWLLGKQLEASRLGTRDDAGSIAVYGVVAGVIGARLYHVVTDWSRFEGDLGSIPLIWEGGLGIPGGLVGGIVVGAWQAKRRGVRPAVAITFGAPAIALAQAIGRWGNWFNQELFGKPTDLPWALEIDGQYAVQAGYTPGTTFHPTFLYESLWNLALCAVLLWIQRRFQLAAGRLLGVYLIGYGAGRFWIEGLRVDPSHDIGGLRLNQWMALAAVIAGAVLLVVTRGRKWDERPRDDVPDIEQPDDQLTGSIGESQPVSDERSGRGT